MVSVECKCHVIEVTQRDLLKRAHKDLEHDDDKTHDGKQGEKHSDHQSRTPTVLIDRLAARVLDFDLRCVQKRMEKDDEAHKKP